MTQSISNRLRDIVRITRICGNICGADVLNHDYRYNYRTVIILVVIHVTFICLATTMYEGRVSGGDWKIILQGLSIGGGTLTQGYCKLMNCLRHKANYRALLDDIYSLYEEYELKNSHYRLILIRGTNLLKFFMKLCAFINICLSAGMAILSLTLALVFNKPILMVYGKLPGIDPSTMSGYLMTNGIQIVFMTLGAFGLYAGDMSFLTTMSQIGTFKGILQCKFRDLNGIISCERDHRRKSLEALKDIIKFHQRYLRFLAITQETYYWVILVEIITTSVGIVCSLFCVLLGTWPAGYIYMVYCFVMMYVYCGVGTMVELSNEGFIDACYNDVYWYDMSVQQQKMLNIMLIMTQKTEGLTIGSVQPLSMNTGLRVTKTIYSIAMMLFNFAE